MLSSGPLLPADELLVHQVPQTFARVGSSDRSWTEKVWAMAAAKDGSLSVAFGLGKYPNRNVMDGFAGVSRGTEQWTVRASRRLSPTPDVTAVGPVRYEIVEALSAVRIALEPNDIGPIAFECVLHGVVPPAVEAPEVHTSRSRYRIDADVVRFHQPSLAEGWVEVDGRRVEVTESTWVGARDRSWGVRYEVGKPPDDIEPASLPPGASSLTLYMVVTMTDADGSPYGLFVYHQRHSGPGWSTGGTQGAIELPGGRRLSMAEVESDLRFDDANRRLVGGALRCTMADGTRRDLTVRPASDTGFHLGTGLYGGWRGHWHGQWRGDLHVEGEHVAACEDPQTARELHQHRDCIVVVEDPVHGGAGVGTLQSIVAGAHPAIGLTEEASFI
jgi:hypothetical protein